MSSVHAVTEDIKFEARIASFYQLDKEAKRELLLELSKVFTDVGRKHNFIVWRVQMLEEKAK